MAGIVSALVSGGKDSIYSAYLFDCQGGTVDELVVLTPENPDSWMFHTPNLDLVRLQAEAWGKSYRALRVSGTGEADEVRALGAALSGSPGWVVAGAIASSYQWSRLHRACYKAGRPLFTPLWGKTGKRVVEEELAAGLDIRLVHLAAEPLTPELLGQRLNATLLEELDRRSTRVRPLHLAGEGGEYESLVVDAPFFSKRLEIVTSESESRGYATRLNVREARLIDKKPISPPAAEKNSKG